MHCGRLGNALGPSNLKNNRPQSLGASYFGNTSTLRRYLIVQNPKPQTLILSKCNAKFQRTKIQQFKKPIDNKKAKNLHLGFKYNEGGAFI
jgi:hypothetical protein